MKKYMILLVIKMMILLVIKMIMMISIYLGPKENNFNFE